MSDLFFGASLATLIFLILGGLIIRKMQKRKKWYISIIVVIGFFVAIYIWCLGALLSGDAGENEVGIIHGIPDFLLALQNTLGIFAVNVSVDFFDDLLKASSEKVRQCYAIYTSFLLAAAPILTVSMILSFFNGVVAFVKIFFSIKKKIFVFSELNQESLSIAKSCKQEVKKSLIIFTDVYKDNAEYSAEMLESARALDAICVKRDILAVNYFINPQKTWIGKIIAHHEECNFFIIGKNEDENIKFASSLFERYYKYSNVKLYLFSECNITKIMTTAMLKAKNDELQAPVKVKKLREHRAELYREVLEDEARRIKEEELKKTKNTEEDTQNTKNQAVKEIEITEEDLQNAKKQIGESIEEKIQEKLKEKYKKELRDVNVKMTIRCYNIKQNVIYNYLYTHNLFEELNKLEEQQKAAERKAAERKANERKATENKADENEANERKDVHEKEIQKEDMNEETATKELSIGVAGDGNYVKELIKALIWYGQMPGYELKLHVFDEGLVLKEYFEYECPELMDKNGITKNGNIRKGDAKYDLHFYDCSPGTVKYKEQLEKINRFSHLYFMYEEDEKNIDAGIDARRILKSSSKIVCLIRSNGKKQMLQGENPKNKSPKLIDYRGEGFDLEFLYEEWDYNFSINRDLEDEAVEEHKKWVNDPNFNDDYQKKYIKKSKASVNAENGEEIKQIEELNKEKLMLDEEEAKEDFFNYDYNYRSSVTRAIRTRKRWELKIGDADLAIDNRDEQVKEKQQEAEHMGWNAYMRTEGYCYGKDKSARYKLHDCLVVYHELKEKNKEKDVDRQYLPKVEKTNEE